MSKQESDREADSTISPQTRAMRPLTLSFVDPVLERHYHDARLSFRLNASRISALAGVIAWQVFTFLDASTIRDPSEALFYLRLVAAGGMLVLFVALLLAKPGRWVEPLGVLTLVTNIVFFTLVMGVMTEASVALFLAARHFHDGGGHVVRAGRHDLHRGHRGSPRSPSPVSCFR